MCQGRWMVDERGRHRKHGMLSTIGCVDGHLPNFADLTSNLKYRKMSVVLTKWIIFNRIGIFVVKDFQYAGELQKEIAYCKHQLSGFQKMFWDLVKVANSILVDIWYVA